MATRQIKVAVEVVNVKSEPLYYPLRNLIAYIYYSSLEKPVERSLEKESIVFHDPRVNIPLKPGIQIWSPRFLNSRQIVQEARFGNINDMQNKAKIVSTLSPRRDQECDNNNETTKKRANTERPPFPVTKSFENETGRKKARIDFEDKELISATDSTFPSTAIADHEHSGIPSQNSPVQVIL